MKFKGALSFKSVSVLFGLFVLVATSSSGCADFRPGRDAYLRGDYSQAFELFLPSALQGSTNSRIGLGLLLARGDGLKADFVRSYSWFDMAVAEGQDEHIVVQILARTNRDYLASRMTEADIARAKLRAAMMLAALESRKAAQAKSEARTDEIPGPVKASARMVPVSASNSVTMAESPPSAQYNIQLATRRAGQATDLLMAWSDLADEYDVLSDLEPRLVRVDLGQMGAYDSLRAGPFETAGGALAACAVLADVLPDCLVLLK